MLVIKPIGHRNVLFIPLIVAGFVTTQKQNGGSSWIKGIQGSVRATFMLGTKLSQLAMFRAIDATAVWKRQLRASFFQELHSCSNRNLLLFSESEPPILKFIRVFDFPALAAILP